MLLFKDRNLSTAILISAIWHFLFIFSVKPVLPVGHIIEHNTSIAFLGDILEKIMPEGEKPFILDHVSPDNKIGTIQQADAGFINTLSQDKELLYSLGGQRVSMVSAGQKKEAGRTGFSDFFIKGQARDRIVVYKPDLEKVSVIPSDFSSGFSVNVKFRISKDGHVKYAEPAISSGDIMIDRLAVRHVLKWLFVPATEDDQEGLVRISFKQ